jgi:hypothetical protein
MTPAERSWGRSILVPSADPAVKTGRGMGGGRGEGLQYRLTKIHRGHRGSHYSNNVTYAPMPRCSVPPSPSGPRSTSRHPIYRRPLAREDKATGARARELNKARRGKYQILGTRYLQISREAVRIQRACFLADCSRVVLRSSCQPVADPVAI